MISHQTSPLSVYTLAVSIYIILISWRTLVFLKDQTLANNNKKKIQSSKSWYLKIALILNIENPSPVV